ncbi:hypothetical protein [Halobacillus trueperi]
MMNVLIVDDHPAVGAGTKSMLEQEGDMQVDVTHENQKVEPLLKEKKL